MRHSRKRAHIGKVPDGSVGGWNERRSGRRSARRGSGCFGRAVIFDMRLSGFPSMMHSVFVAAARQFSCRKFLRKENAKPASTTDSTSASVNGMSLWPFTRMMQPWPQTGERDGDLDSATHAEGWSIVGRRQIARRNHVSPVLPMTPILGSHALPGTPNHSFEKPYIY